MRIYDVAKHEALDKQGMLAVVERFPEQCQEALMLGPTVEAITQLKRGAIEHLLLIGMGGSGIAAALLQGFLLRPAAAVRGSQIPGWANEKTLLIAISYSGDTEETLKAVESGLHRGARALCLSGGGALAQLARDRGLSLLAVPPGLQPRAALGYLFLPPYKALSGLNLVSAPLDEAVLLRSLAAQTAECRREVPSSANPAKRLAQDLLAHVPFIYGTAGNTDVVAQRWKTQINENAKRPACWGILPEICHNEIEAFRALPERLPGARVYFLTNDYDLPRNLKRVDILRDELRALDIPNAQIHQGRHGERSAEPRLHQLLQQIQLGDFASVYLALLSGVDPTPVEAIQRCKQRMTS